MHLLHAYICCDASATSPFQVACTSSRERWRGEFPIIGKENKKNIRRAIHRPCLLTQTHIWFISHLNSIVLPAQNLPPFNQELYTLARPFLWINRYLNHACRISLEGRSSSRSSVWRHSLRPNGEPTCHTRGYFWGLYSPWVRRNRQKRPAEHDIPALQQGVREYAANPTGGRPFFILQRQHQRRGHSVRLLLGRISRRKLHGNLYGLPVGAGLLGTGLFQQMQQCAAGLHWAKRDVRGQERAVFLRDAVRDLIDRIDFPSALGVSWFADWNLEMIFSHFFATKRDVDSARAIARRASVSSLS